MGCKLTRRRANGYESEQGTAVPLPATHHSQSHTPDTRTLAYYHCFMGNGIDAVLIGPTGSMVADKAQGLERCYWYKSDRYYPEEKLVTVVPNRRPAQKPLPRLPGYPWRELAPLGHTWYEIRLDGQKLELRSSSQRFIPEEGTLYTEADYGPVKARITTFLCAQEPLLVEHYEFNQEVEFVAFFAPGVWQEEDYETEPFTTLEFPEGSECRYRLGSIEGYQALALDTPPEGYGRDGKTLWLLKCCRAVTKYYAVVDDKYSPLDTEVIARAQRLGYRELRQRHMEFWNRYFSSFGIRIPDPDFDRFYRFSYYLFKAAQNPVSGGLPVNNLRLTWSSHLFWDSFFIQRALLEAGRTSEALGACRFLQRTLPAARKHAQEDFGCAGLKWDWELTHEGQRAYGTYVHLKEQVHNNAAYSNEIWQYYCFTGDIAFLEEFFPILEGIARFFMECVVEKTGRGYGVRPLVGVDERPIRRRNEGMTLTGAIRVFRNFAAASEVLKWDSPFVRRCKEVTAGLMDVLDRLYNGRYFQAAEGYEHLNMSSLAPIYPMELCPYDDPRALSTARAYLERYRGRMVGHGGDEDGFPWSAGVLATILAHQGDADAAWDVIARTRPALCQYGGVAERVYKDGRWNMQYFGTAHGALCTAINALLLQERGEEIHLFPAIPSLWEGISFEGFLCDGLLISADLDNPKVWVKNITVSWRRKLIRAGDKVLEVNLRPGEEGMWKL